MKFFSLSFFILLPVMVNKDIHRKSQAGRFMSVPMTLSDHEKPDVRNQFFFRRILITLVRSATSLNLHKCVARFVSDK